MEKFIDFVNNNMINEAATLIVELYTENPKSFRKNILFGKILPEPTQRAFDKVKFARLETIFFHAVDVYKGKNSGDEGLLNEVLQIFISIKLLREANENNIDRLEKNLFAQRDYLDKLKCFSIFMQDQYRLMIESNRSQPNEQRLFTGFEMELEKNETGQFSTGLSYIDTYEATIDVADTFFRLFGFLNKKEIETQSYDEKVVIPYNDGSFEEILHLGAHRNLIDVLWGKFKYDNWDLKKNRQGSIDFLQFEPQNKRELLIGQIATLRYKQEELLNTSIAVQLHMKENQRISRSMELFARTAGLNIERHLEIDIEKYKIYRKLMDTISDPMKRRLSPIFKRLSYNGIPIEIFEETIQFLQVIAMTYDNSISIHFKQKNLSMYGKLAPMVKIERLCTSLSRLHNYDMAKARCLVDMLIFKNDKNIDVYSQPLIYCGKDTVLFVPCIIQTLNQSRAIEQHVKKWGVEISKKGPVYEEELRVALGSLDFLKVNRNPIEYIDYKERKQEFDFLAMFDDHLIVMEVKHIGVPYDENTKYNARDTLEYAVEQVKRRVDSIPHDWSILKELCSFELPEVPIEKSKIIKIVCTNIYNFTSIEIDGVPIMDSSSLKKFFTNPIISFFNPNAPTNRILERKLWRGSTPEVNEFKEFLKSPSTLDLYEHHFKEVFRPVIRINENEKNVVFFDYSLVTDPIAMMAKAAEQSQDNKKGNIGRNDPCLCGSGKKNKKCCNWETVSINDINKR